jgi:hypothetical protein
MICGFVLALCSYWYFSVFLSFLKAAKNTEKYIITVLKCALSQPPDSQAQGALGPSTLLQRQVHPYEPLPSSPFRVHSASPLSEPSAAASTPSSHSHARPDARPDARSAQVCRAVALSHTRLRATPTCNSHDACPAIVPQNAESSFSSAYSQSLTPSSCTRLRPVVGRSHDSASLRSARTLAELNHAPIRLFFFLPSCLPFSSPSRRRLPGLLSSLLSEPASSSSSLSSGSRIFWTRSGQRARLVM